MASADLVTAAAYIDTAAMLFLERYKRRGPHPEYQEFERAATGPTLLQTSPRVGQQINSWDLIRDAVDGRGGFSDGSYVVPHSSELNTVAGRAKFLERVDGTAYENFAKTICDTPWKYIAKGADFIKRTSEDKDLEEWWSAVDGRTMRMTDFLEYPARQARMYGTGWVFLDRQPGPYIALAQSTDRRNWPYAYSVPTRRVVDWQFDADGGLSAITVLEPLEGYEEEAETQIRIWTRTGWMLFIKSKPEEGKSQDAGAAEWVSVDGGPNKWGVVPAVPIFDEAPEPKCAMGTSVMLDVARAARQHYNMKSEIREVERASCFSMLAVALDDPAQIDKVKIGALRLLAYSTKAASQPSYVEPVLPFFDKLLEDARQTKEGAFAAADMAAMLGFESLTQSTSGFHEEAIFERTNTRIGKFAGSLEKAETEIAALWRTMMGRPVDPRAVQIDYPRDFGLRDMAALQNRTKERLEMGLGVADATRAITDYYTALYPRDDPQEVKGAAEQAAKDLYAGKMVQTGVTPIQARVAKLFTKPAAMPQMSVMTPATGPMATEVGMAAK